MKLEPQRPRTRSFGGDVRRGRARKMEAQKEAEKAAEKVNEGASGGRSTGRRGRELGSFDVVRSEEEMNAVLAQLAAEEKRERSDLWIANQCAKDTPMILEPTRSLLARFETRSCLIEDANADEKERKKRCVWTDAEKKIFADKWMVYPKVNGPPFSSSSSSSRQVDGLPQGAS